MQVLGNDQPEASSINLKLIFVLFSSTCSGLSEVHQRRMWTIQSKPEMCRQEDHPELGFETRVSIKLNAAVAAALQY